MQILMNIFGMPRARWIGIVVAESSNKIEEGKPRESKKIVGKIDAQLFAES